MTNSAQHVVWFNEIDRRDGAQVGGKGANLGEMVGAGFPVPDGFVVTAQAYYAFLDANELRTPIKKILEPLDVNDSARLQTAAKEVRQLILKAKMPADQATSILTAYQKLGKNCAVAVRSSATAEDLPDASFAGQQATYLNIAGDNDVLEHVQKAWASLFEARAVFYRGTRGFDHFKVGIAVPVQRMVQSDISGVMFSINPVNNETETIIIEAIWGLGENIVQGSVTPDHYEVEKGTWDVTTAEVVAQDIEMIRKGAVTKNYPVPRSRQKARKLTEKQVVVLAKLAQKLQDHYQHPQDIEWAIENDRVYIVQTRPITTIDSVKERGQVTSQLERVLAGMKVLLEGESASPGVISGPVRHIPTVADIPKLKVGEIMVTDMTTPDFVPAMKKAGGLITNRGGQTSHAAIVSRELGLPCVVGTDTATKTLKSSQLVTMSGQHGRVYAGEIDPKLLEQAKQATSHQNEPHITTATKIYVNLAEPELAADIAKRHVDGIGLLRAEFIIAQLGYHPKKLIQERKGKVFVNHMAKNIAAFCEPFGDRPVVYRTTDFKTNEYRHLIGGAAYEPEEENPLIGYRGAFRYAHDRKLFELELEAIQKVRQTHKNLWVMIPFVRSVGEFREVRKIMFEAGLRRSSSFKIWMMAEIPENVIMIDDYIDTGIDGISIGTNDLTMLMLGADRDNENVASAYDERHPAVQWALERLVSKCRARGVTVSVCGQGPSTYHELAQQLVKWGVTSLSVSPDTIETTREMIAATERALTKKG